MKVLCLFPALSVNYDLTRWVVTIWWCNVLQPNHLWYFPWKSKTINILLPNSGWLRFPPKEIVFSENLWFMSWPYQSWCLGIGRRWFSVSNLGGAHLDAIQKMHQSYVRAYISFRLRSGSQKNKQQQQQQQQHQGFQRRHLSKPRQKSRDKHLVCLDQPEHPGRWCHFAWPASEAFGLLAGASDRCDVHMS